MSIESAKAFYFRMTTDETFRTQLEQAASKEERQQILQAADYEFTSQEWEAAKAQFQASNDSSELSNSELQAVSGGLPGLVPVYGTPALFNIPDNLF
ncbi:Nif11-like leader peptide family natural product precursor [uncultured Nostoc sp.]|uniref:Nif11-like leader peptide family natural product precursor n=1 Tax=uncultured Nostoc sp. TaxID=340711 RepID=UPI0035CC4557